MARAHGQGEIAGVWSEVGPALLVWLQRGIPHRCRRRGRCQDLQRVFADEITDEARGLEKINRQANEMTIDSGTALVQKSIWHNFCTVDKKNEDAD